VTAPLSAGTLAGLLRDAGLPCVTLTATETAAAAIPATPRDEGLRIVDGTLPVRLAYPIPRRDEDEAAYWAALRRRDSHVLWLYDFAERHRWSADRDGDNEWITISPQPRPATYTRDGREVARRNGRAVDENLGTWVTLWIVEDAEAWAAAIEAEVAAEIALAPKKRRFATYMQQQQLDGATRIRAEGPNRSVHRVHHDQAAALASVASLYQGCPNPGVRYEPARITGYAACITCFCPMIEAGGRWWHHTGRYPAQCPGRRPARDLPAEPGAWEFSSGLMTCGYCGMSVHWKEVDMSWVQLTGAWMLGVQLEVPETGPGSGGHRGDLVVLAETEGIARRPGQRDVLPHHCENIPAEVRAEYASEIEAITTRTEPQ
jgi:hypothetical protein